MKVWKCRKDPCDEFSEDDFNCKHAKCCCKCPPGPRGPTGPSGPPGARGAVGATGAAGPQGLIGPAGVQGLAGPTGATGPAGAVGATGAAGPQGLIGLVGPQGIAGPTGAAGPAGPTGAAGATGPAGGVLAFADFFALMTPDNAAAVDVGSDVEFPQNGPASTFNLSAIGTYQVLFQVSVTETGQLILTLDPGTGAVDQPYTVVGRASETSQIVGIALVTTTVINSLLTVRNPSGNSTALTITPLTGGTRPVSAHPTIMRIA